MRARLVVLTLGLAAVVHGQLVSVVPADPHYCEKFKVASNLTVEHGASISGRVIDVSGEPFRQSRVDLRLFISPTSQKSVQVTMTDADGRFRFKEVKAGKYRLIASPTRAFEQPAHLLCEEVDCDLLITLRPSPTDMPPSQCPVR